MVLSTMNHDVPGGLTRHSGSLSKVNAAGFRAVGLDRDGGMSAV